MTKIKIPQIELSEYKCEKCGRQIEYGEKFLSVYLPYPIVNIERYCDKHYVKSDIKQHEAKGNYATEQIICRGGKEKWQE